MTERNFAWMNDKGPASGILSMIDIDSYINDGKPDLGYAIFQTIYTSKSHDDFAERMETLREAVLDVYGKTDKGKKFWDSVSERSKNEILYNPVTGLMREEIINTSDKKERQKNMRDSLISYFEIKFKNINEMAEQIPKEYVVGVNEIIELANTGLVQLDDTKSFNYEITTHTSSLVPVLLGGNYSVTVRTTAPIRKIEGTGFYSVPLSSELLSEIEKPLIKNNDYVTHDDFEEEIDTFYEELKSKYEELEWNREERKDKELIGKEMDRIDRFKKEMKSYDKRLLISEYEVKMLDEMEAVDLVSFLPVGFVFYTKNVEDIEQRWAYVSENNIDLLEKTIGYKPFGENLRTNEDIIEYPEDKVPGVIVEPEPTDEVSYQVEEHKEDFRNISGIGKKTAQGLIKYASDSSGEEDPLDTDF